MTAPALDATVSADDYDGSLITVYEDHELLIDADADGTFQLVHAPARATYEVLPFVMRRPQIVALADFLASPIGVRFVERARSSLEEDLSQLEARMAVPQPIAEWLFEQVEGVLNQLRKLRP